MVDQPHEEFAQLAVLKYLELDKANKTNSINGVSIAQVRCDGTKLILAPPVKR